MAERHELSGMSEEEVRARLQKIYEWAGLELDCDSAFVKRLDSYTHGSAGYEHAQSDVMDFLTEPLDRV